MNTKILLLVLIAIVLISIPLTLLLTQRKQETRTRANVSTTLSFTPASTTTTPIQKSIGDNFSVDIMVNPGTNLVSFVRFQVKYDPSKISLTQSNPFVPNISAFPVTIEGPVTTNDTLAASVNIGGDPTKAIQTTTKLGTLNFKAVGSTNGTPTQITFTTLTQVLSAGATDQAGENILSTTTPANLNIGSANGSPAPTNNPTGTPAITPGPTQATTILKFDLLLHGVGSAGDNPNPQGSSLSNKNPLHPQRNLAITIIDSNNQEVKSLTGSITYTPGKGNFEGKIDLGPNFPTGNYSIKMKSDRYLRKLAPGIVNIENLQENPVPKTTLVAGDVKDDNVLNVLDYNILLDCGYGAINPLPLADPNSIYNSNFCKAHTTFTSNTDIEDNGIVNSPDYNLFLRELSVQNGD